MKKQIIVYIILILTSTAGISQNIFNKIIEDTIANITNSIIVLDTGYVYLSGTGNEYGVRSFALTHVNEAGEKQWKKIFGDPVLEHWEGWFGNLKKSKDFYYLGSGVVNTITGEYGIHISKFDSILNMKTQSILFYDNIDKRAYHTVLSNDSCFYITGVLDCPDIGNAQLMLLKADNSGNYLWHKLYGPNVYELGSYIIETSEGNILTVGDTWVTHINNTRWYFLKTDTAGNKIWERTYGRNNYNNGRVLSMIETSDSNFIACGAYPVARYGGGTGEYLWDGCLRKIDKNGELVWERLYRFFSKITNPEMIHIESSINDIIYKGEDLFILGNHRDHRGASRGFLQKISNTGNIYWHRSYYASDTTTSYQWLVSIKNTDDGGFVMVGYGNEYNWQGYDPPQQAWLVKTDSLGMDGLSNIESDQLNIDIDLPATMNCKDTLNVYIHISGKSAPYTLEFSTGQVIDSIFYPPVFVPQEIGLGPVNLYWHTDNYFNDTIQEATISNHEWGQCIVKPIDFFAPSANGEHTVYITVTDAYGESKTITKEITVYNCSENFVQDQQKQSFNIYPNPAQNTLYIEYPAIKEQKRLNIFDPHGKKMLSKQINKAKSEIDIRNLPAGSYVVEVSGEVISFSIVK